MKTLKSQLLKKLSIKFYETQDVSSLNGKPKLLVYDYSCLLFFSPANRRGEPWTVGFLNKYLHCKFQTEKMYANGHEQGRSSKWEATPKYGHFTTRESGSPGFWKNSTRSCWSIRVWVSNLKFLAFFDKFCNIFYLKRFLKNSRIPFDTLGITTTNSIPTHHLLNKGFHYSPFPQLNDIVAKGNY